MLSEVLASSYISFIELGVRMSDIILHHYPMSLFSEKIRLLLGYQKQTWQSVSTPPVMPKPDVLALTGGNRRTPFMQIGADIYCDTALILRKLAALAPEANLFPNSQRAVISSMADWADTTLFQIAVTITFQPAVVAKMFRSEEEMTVFVRDRAAMREGVSSRRPRLEEAQAAYKVFMSDMNTQMHQAGPFIFGDLPVAADFSVYHPLWFLRQRPMLMPLLEAYPAVLEWMDRMAAFGHGDFSEISSAQAIEIAKASTAIIISNDAPCHELSRGMQVEVLPTDYALDPVKGELLRCNEHEIALRREDSRAGELVVHFPRVHYELREAK